jgi:hypothetical protein
MTRGVNRSDLRNGRVGGAVLSFNRYPTKPTEQPPTLTLEELRAEHERLIVPLLRTMGLATQGATPAVPRAEEQIEARSESEV